MDWDEGVEEGVRGEQERPNTAGSLSVRLHVYRFLKAPNWWITAPCDYLHPWLRGQPTADAGSPTGWFHQKLRPRWSCVCRKFSRPWLGNWPPPPPPPQWVTRLFATFFFLFRSESQETAQVQSCLRFASLFSFSSPGIALQQLICPWRHCYAKFSSEKFQWFLLPLAEESQPSPTREVKEN